MSSELASQAAILNSIVSFLGHNLLGQPGSLSNVLSSRAWLAQSSLVAMGCLMSIK